MDAGQGEVREDVDDLLDGQSQGCRVLADEVDEGRLDLRVGRPRRTRGVAVLGHDPGRPQGGHDADQPVEMALHHRHRRDEALVERCGAVDRVQLLDRGSRVEHGCRTGVHELVLAAEGAEDGALGHACGLRHLPGGERGAVLAEEGQGHLDERGPTFVGAERGGTGGHPLHPK